MAACAARPVTPVAITQLNDEKISCSDIAAEIKANSAAESEYVRKDKNVEAKNFVGVAVFPPLIDLSNTEQVKARSIMDRNERLAFLAKSKGCSEP